MPGAGLLPIGVVEDRAKGSGGQLLADASGATVEVPMQEEAGCLGAAIQAMYFYSRGTTTPESFAEIAGRCVAVEPSRSAAPNSALRTAYRRARDQYESSLNAAYPNR